MKCTVEGCPGHYEKRRLVHTVRTEAEVLVFENVPADVCDVCSDTLLAPETIERLQALIDTHPEPDRQVPVYSYA